MQHLIRGIQATEAKENTRLQMNKCQENQRIVAENQKRQQAQKYNTQHSQTLITLLYCT